MSRSDISFQTSDGVTLRGWFYTPSTTSSTPLPCLVLSHGFSALKEMDLDTFASYFTTHLPISCLVYDNRGFGSSDHAPGHPRHEIIPSLQTSDISDAITYAQSLDQVDSQKIGIWGSSYSGGHVLWVGAVDRRVKAVLSQVPCVDGWSNFHRLIRPDFVPGMNEMFQADRLARAAGKEAGTIPVVDADPSKPSALPTPDSYTFFSAWEKKSDWKNECTIKTISSKREIIFYKFSQAQLTPEPTTSSSSSKFKIILSAVSSHQHAKSNTSTFLTIRPTINPTMSEQQSTSLPIPSSLPTASALAAVQEASLKASIEIAMIEYRNGGDPVRDRELELMVENQGKTKRELEVLIEEDGILRALRGRGVREAVK
ncbi:hypothetical protein VTL71DRAFT_15088 [Oculimacula yallundae]|uniref:AB hydrolase-1 domain-containing protein n=1 Tax=Oculimacula yallundae TaxID=86028 RepID=A0ABR4CFM0_9HELO